MKFSKVDNAKTAVYKKISDKSVSGNLYFDEKNPKNKELKEHINNRIDAGKRLYSVLNTKTFKEIKEIKNSTFKTLATNFNNVLKNSVKENNINSLLKPKKDDKIIENINKLNNDKNFNIEYNSKLIVKISLKKSLRKYEDLLAKLLELYCCKDNSYSTYVTENKQKLQNFFNDLQEDYNKIDFSKKVYNSIKNQTVPVKYINDENLLALSSYTPENRDLRKNKLFELLIAYTKKFDIIQMQNVLRDFLGKREDYDDFLNKTFDEARYEKKDGKISYDNGKIRENLNKYICKCYRNHTDENEFLFSLLEKYFEQYFKDKRHISYNNKEKYLDYENLVYNFSFKLCNYFCGKYIDMGKALYHFGDWENDNFNGIKENYKKEITSFDYEIIRAKEILNQNFSASLVYAVQNFSFASKKENIENSSEEEQKNDLMFIKFDEKNQKNREKYLKDEYSLLLSLMRFFGGKSNYDLKTSDGFKLFNEIKENLSSLRNKNFHYVEGLKKSKSDNNKDNNKEVSIIDQIIKKDIEQYPKFLLRTYQNNNVFVFYEKDKVVDFINGIYQKPKKIHKFIPSFKTVFNKNELKELIKAKGVKLNLEWEDKYISSLYFILKQIYYYEFLSDEKVLNKYFNDSKKQYKEYIKQQDKEKNKTIEKTKEQNKLQKAWNNFESSICKNNSTFSKVCQNALMMYSLQNQEYLYDKENNKDKETFKHYKLILNKLTCIMFEKYLENKKYEFLFKEIKYDENTLNPQYIDDISNKCQIKLILSDLTNDLYKEFYVFGKFLSPRQLNFLRGDLENYIQYREDIQNRGKICNIDIQIKDSTDYTSIIGIIDFCMITNGQISNELKDYYIDNDDFAQNLKGYIDFSKNSSADNAYKELQDFLSSVDISDISTNKNKIYIDEKNPILLRGIELSRMYGVDRIIKEAVKDHKINKKDFENLKKLRKSVKNAENETTDFKEFKKNQENIREYQNFKSKIELFDIQAYSNIIFDLYSALINWCYLKERDTLYFLLGYYYIKQYWAKDENLNKDILINIYYAYKYGMGMIYRDEEGNEKKYKNSNKKNVSAKNGLLGAPIQLKKDFINTYIDTKFFENEKILLGRYSNSYNNKDSFNLRNEIDHFNYFSTQNEYNLLELYKEMFYFLGYNKKLQDNVLKKISVVLEHYFLKTHIIWEDNKTINCSPINKNSNKNIISDEFTYKLKNSKADKKDEVKVKARSKEFCTIVENILKIK